MTQISRAALAACAALALPLAACQKQPEDAFGQKVRAYLLEHPEVIEEAVVKLQQNKQAQAQEAAKASLAKFRQQLERDPRDFVANPDGKITVVEFFDYQCIWCSRLAPELEKVMKANTNVRYYFMEWPVFGSRWPESLLAAKTGLQVWKEKGAEAYLTYHNNIYGTGLNEGRLTQEIIEKQSGKINFNQHTIEAINNTLKNINQIATTTGLTGTPGVIIMPLNGATEDNTTVFSGMTEAENIQQAINKAQGK